MTRALQDRGSLAVQWLSLHISSAGGTGLNLVKELRSHVLDATTSPPPPPQKKVENIPGKGKSLYKHLEA